MNKLLTWRVCWALHLPPALTEPTEGRGALGKASGCVCCLSHNFKHFPRKETPVRRHGSRGPSLCSENMLTEGENRPPRYASLAYYLKLVIFKKCRHKSSERRGDVPFGKRETFHSKRNLHGCGGLQRSLETHQWRRCRLICTPHPRLVGGAFPGPLPQLIPHPDIS